MAADGLFAYNSSLRSRPVAESLRLATELAPTLGVVRVTDTTRLDRLGVPVFASIRPDAERGSLCVSAGKGLTPEEAKIGAIMEAIELAWAEPRQAALAIEPVPPDRLVAPLATFCPRRQAVLDGRPVDAVRAHDVVTGEEHLVPAELVLYPLVARYFTSDTNGLASGNTLLEATVHGLAEALERDVGSFQRVWDRSSVVRNDTLPEPLASIARRAEDAGCVLTVRSVPNEFDLPYFHAVLREVGARNAVHSGYGLHAWRSIAVTRAVIEAFQSRLSFIHGGRDDLAMINMRLGSQRSDMLHRFAERNAEDPNPIAIDDVVDRSPECQTIEATWAVLAAAAGRVGPVLRVRFTPEDYPFQIVRIVVPGLEFYTHDTDRMGARLRRYLRARAAAG